MDCVAMQRALLPGQHLSPGATSRPASSRPRSAKLTVRAVGWDPEGILAAPQPGHISRRQYQKKLMQADQEAELLEAQERREAERRRQVREARVVPEDDAGLVEYLLKILTEEDDKELEYEVARSGARFTDAFLTTLRTSMGSIRFAARQTEADTQRLSSLEKLEKHLLEHLEEQKALQQSLVGAKERLQDLLSSKDKKEKILSMSAAGELDMALLSLLDENIVAARQANQASAVEFMEKIRGAVVKYMPKQQEEKKKKEEPAAAPAPEPSRLILD